MYAYSASVRMSSALRRLTEHVGQYDYKQDDDTSESFQTRYDSISSHRFFEREKDPREGSRRCSILLAIPATVGRLIPRLLLPRLSMTTENPKKSIAATIGQAYGVEMTKAVASGDVSGFRSLFVDGPVLVVLQNAVGEEAEFTIADASPAGEEQAAEGVTMTWDEFRDSAIKDLTDQDYEKTETQCLGTLGDRMIMETGRFNKSGQVYLETYQLISFNSEGKITAVELFSDPATTTLFEAASSAPAEE